MQILNALLVCLLVAADQFTKYLAQIHLKGHSQVLIPGALELCYLENHGAAFGILKDREWFFIIATVLFLIALVFVYLRLPEGASFRLHRFSMLLLAAGAAGNLIDRVRTGSVRDFIYFSLIDFPVFNVADICVTVGAGLLIVCILFFTKEEDLTLKGKKNE